MKLSASPLKSPCRLRYRPESTTTLAALWAVGAILLLSWAVLAAYERVHSPSVLTIDPESTSLWGPHEINACYLYIAGLYDSRGQRLAHQFALVATGLLVLLGRPLYNSLLRFVPQGRALAYGTLALGCAVVLLACFGEQPVSSRSYVLGLLLFLLLCFTARLVLKGVPNRAFLLASLALVALVTLPGAVGTFNFSHYDPYSIVDVEHHTGVIIGDADRLAAGHRLLEDANPRYGMLLPLLMAAFQRYCHPLDMEDCIRIFQALQILYILVALYLFREYCGGRWVFCLLALLMVVPWYHFHGEFLLYPNLGAWRTLAFPVGLFAVYRLRTQRFVPAAYLLGCVGGVALLVNLESGVAASAGLITYLYFRYRVWEQPSCAARALVLLMLFSGGLATSVFCFLAACFTLFGYWPNLLLMSRALEWSSFFAATGFGGTKFEYHLLPVIMFGHASFVLIHTALRDRTSINFVRSFRACVSATMVVWFAYYAYRPNSWNLSSFHFLYAFLFIDILQSSIVNFRRGTVNLSGILAAGIIVLVTIPNFCEFYGYEYQAVRARRYIMFRKPVTPSATLVSGVLLPEEERAKIVKKAEFIRRTARDQTTVYLSPHSFLITKVSGVVSPLPAGDLWVETRTRSCYQKLLSDLARSQASTVCLDVPGSDPWWVPRFHSFFVQLREDLAAHYQWECDVDGWEVWRRRE